MSRSSPRRAKVAIPNDSTSAAAVTSCVESGFDAARYTSAPPAFSVRIRLAVSVVTWRQAPMRRPASGRSRSKRSRIWRRTGISRSAHSMRRRPSAARERSVTSCGTCVVASVIGVPLAGRRRTAGRRVGLVVVGGAARVLDGVARGGGVGLLARAAREQPAERGGEVGPGRGGAADQPLLEPGVLGVAEAQVRLDRGRVVGSHVEHDLVAVPEQLRRHRGRHRLGIAPPAMVGVREHVADDGQAGVARDHVRAGGRRRACR